VDCRIGDDLHVPNWNVWGREQQTTYALMITEGRIQVGISFINLSILLFCDMFYLLRTSIYPHIALP
jgi:hypothetical protein